MSKTQRYFPKKYHRRPKTTNLLRESHAAAREILEFGFNPGNRLKKYANNSGTRDTFNPSFYADQPIAANREMSYRLKTAYIDRTDK
jgi:hypothetical protein